MNETFHELASVRKENMENENQRVVDSANLRAIRAIQKLAAITAHDVNNVLTPIIGFGRMLNEEITDPSMKEDLGELMSAAKRGLDLCGRYAKISQFRDPEMIPVELVSLLRSSEGMLQHHLGEQVTLQLHLPSSPITAQIDPQHFLMVLEHLSRNAKEALRSTENPKVELYLKPAIEMATLTFEDNGPGFKPEILKELGCPFVTDSTSGNKLSGLGIPLCLAAVASWGGAMQVGNREKEVSGASLKLLLPLADQESVSATKTKAPRFEGMRVLVLERDDMARLQLAGMLEKAGCEAIFAPGAPVDLALIELGHPDERDVLAALRKQNPKPTLLRMAPGMSGPTFLTKPVEERHLHEHLAAAESGKA